jgi:hypothetical protein
MNEIQRLLRAIREVQAERGRSRHPLSTFVGSTGRVRRKEAEVSAQTKSTAARHPLSGMVSGPVRVSPATVRREQKAGGDRRHPLADFDLYKASAARQAHASRIVKSRPMSRHQLSGMFGGPREVEKSVEDRVKALAEVVKGLGIEVRGPDIRRLVRALGIEDDEELARVEAMLAEMLAETKSLAPVAKSDDLLADANKSQLIGALKGFSDEQVEDLLRADADRGLVGQVKAVLQGRAGPDLGSPLARAAYERRLGLI